MEIMFFMIYLIEVITCKYIIIRQVYLIIFAKRTYIIDTINGSVIFQTGGYRKFFFSSIIYSGRALISSNKIPTYCPKTPMVIN